MTTQLIRNARYFIMLALPAVFLAAGCATTAQQNDPSEGGFFRAVQGVSGGQYDERKRQREEELQRQKEIGRRLDARLNELEKEQNELNAEIRKVVARLDEVNAAIEEGMQQLQSVKGERSELAERFRSAQMRVFELRHTLADEHLYTISEIEEIERSVTEIEQLVVALTSEL